MENKRFERVFLLFTREDEGRNGGQNPSGFVKIQSIDGKYRMSASLQGLKQSSSEGLNLYIFGRSSHGMKLYNAGSLVFKQSKCELNKDIDPADFIGILGNINNVEGAVAVGIRNENGVSKICCPVVAFKNNVRINYREELTKNLFANEMEEIEKRELEKKAELKEQEKQRELDRQKELEKLKEQEKIKEKEKQIELERFKELEKQRELEKLEEERQIEIDRLIELEKQRELEIIKEQERFLEQIDNAEISENIDSTKNTMVTSLISEKEENLNETIAKVECEDNGNNASPVEKDGIPQKKEGEFQDYQRLLREFGLSERHDPGKICMDALTQTQKEICDGCDITRREEYEKTSQPINVVKLKLIFNKYFEPYDAFRIKRPDYRWWKVGSPVQLNNILYQNDIKTPLLFNPQLMMAHFKYRHILVGIYSNKRHGKDYVVCGVPAVYNVDEKPYGEFCRWAQLESTRPRHGAFGYWLVYIDIKTGNFLGL